MYVIEVIPLRRGMHTASLSYFSKEAYPNGTLLSIPVRKKLAQGVVIESRSVSLAKAALRGAPVLLRKLPPQKETARHPATHLRTADELSRYYATSPGAVLFALLPNEIKNGNVPTGAEKETQRPVREHVHEVLQAPSDARMLAFAGIVRTSFAEGHSILFVVPTVADGEFLFASLRAGIPRRAYLLHSGLGARTLAAAYRTLKESAVPVLVIATPHHAFLARSDIGTVVIERSRAFSYRGRSRPYIDFRHALLVHARHVGARLITADTLIRTEDELLVREERAAAFEDQHPKRLALPGVLKSIPMKEKKDGKDFVLFSETLLETIEKTRKARGRSFLFCARRGMAPLVACVDCGTILRCPESGSPLALHRVMRGGVEERWLICRVSGYRRRADDTCTVCGSWRLRSSGIGVQQAYDELVSRFGSEDIFLFDYQTASTHKKAAAIRDAFYARKKTILLGTALALPYLHEPVDTSAIVSMDALRAIPSWRQQEETLGTLLALREKTLGYVFAQTRSGDTDFLRFAAEAATSAFYTEELASRERFHYPPYSAFIHLTWKKDKDNALGKEIATALASFDILIYGAPTMGDGLAYGLVRVDRTRWPDDALVDILRSFPPHVRIIINPDRIL
jgi:primosomal protein N'